jgi:uncharacterized protein (TIGR03435 family)
MVPAYCVKKGSYSLHQSTNTVGMLESMKAPCPNLLSPGRIANDVKTSGVTAALLLLSGAAFAQPAFEVASVKPADPSARIIDIREEPGGRLTMVNMTLLRIAQTAYAKKWYWITGGPGWIDRDRFDIVAKADGDPSHDRLMKMLQALLEERFQLKLHTESTEGTVFHIVIAKNGPKLNPPTEKDADPVVLGRFDATNHRLMGQNASLALLARRLEDELRRPVIDLTGIKGNFDFTIDYNIDDSKPENGPSIFSAMQDQLGLKLESAKGLVETLVIDQAQRPSGN